MPHPRSSQTSRNLVPLLSAGPEALPAETERRWRGYALAVITSAAALVLNIGLGRLLSTPISPFLCGFAAILTAAAGAGLGPGILATLLSAAWCVMALAPEHAYAFPARIFAGPIIPCAIFAAEGLFLSVCTAKLSRVISDAARRERWHRSLLETAAEGIWVVDEGGRIIYANPRIGEMLALDASALPGRILEEFIFPADWPQERIRLQNRRRGQKEQFDRRMRRTDGTEVWVLVCASSLPGPLFSGVLVMMTDITERKLAEQALLRSEQRFRSLFENVPEGVYQTTPDGRLLAANTMLLEILGVSGEAELKTLLAASLYVDPDVRKHLTQRLEEEGSFRNIEYELRTRAGRVITVQENARAVRDEDGQLLYYEGTLTDVTDRKRKESQLHEARRMEALHDLSSAAARDLSSLLAGIAAQAGSMVQAPPDAHAVPELALGVLRAAERAAGLAGQLVSFTRRQAAGSSTADLHQVVRECEGVLHQIMAGRSELLISVDVTAAGPAPVHIDRAHLEYLALHLLLSAVETMQPGRTLELRTETTEFTSSLSGQPATGEGESRVGAFAAVTVIGHGWDPLRRRNTEGRAGSGPLHVLTAQYGGFTSIGTLPDGRTGLSVFLPRAVQAERHGMNSRETVLLVDDDTLVRELTRELLELEGYRLLTAGGAAEAQAIAAQGIPFSLLVTDVVMPGLSGPLLAGKLRLTMPDLKVLFISGYAEQQLPDGSLSSAEAFLPKPFSPATLARKVRELLGATPDLNAT